MRLRDVALLMALPCSALLLVGCGIADPNARADSDTVYADTSGKLTVKPDDRWRATGASLRMGDVLSVKASGTVSSPKYGGFGPDGTDTIDTGTFLVRNGRAFGLYGRINKGVPFFIGTSCVDWADRSGTLELAVNTGIDTIGAYADHIESGYHVIDSLVVTRPDRESTASSADTSG
jgi:hypothetical protein